MLGIVWELLEKDNLTVKGGMVIKSGALIDQQVCGELLLIPANSGHRFQKHSGGDSGGIRPAVRNHSGEARHLE
jgi:hypothetical protein